MAAQSLKRPALGQSAALGMLYDARSDKFLSHSILNPTPPAEVITRQEINTDQQAITTHETYKEKFDQLGVSSDLGASFLAGLMNVEGSGNYLLTPNCDTALTAYCALHHIITTVEEGLNFSASGFKDCLSTDDSWNSVSATHLVTEILWGARSIVAATQRLNSESDRSSTEKALESALESFQRRTEAGFEHSDYLMEEFCEVVLHSDLLKSDEEPPTHLQAVQNHFANLPILLQECNEGKGKPMVYTLLPIGFFSMFFGVTIPAIILPVNVSSECQDKYVALLDELRPSQGKLFDYYQRLEKHSACVAPDHIFRVANRVRRTRQEVSELQLSYGKLLKAIRAGRKSSQDMWQLLESFLQGDSAPKALTAITDEYSEKLAFADLVEHKGAKYVGYGGTSRLEFDQIERNNDWGDCYVFYFHDDALKNPQTWNEHQDLLIKILADRSRKDKIFVVDCTATGTPFTELCIVRYENDALITSNVLKRKKHLSDKCLMRYDQRYLDASVRGDPWPPKRKMVKIRCPGHGPSCKGNHEWICSKCLVSVEYGTDDSYMYCECGRVRCRGIAFDFDCQKPGHTQHAKFGDRELLNIMKTMKPPPEINILILGESGVGKSTFINAFINYLTFSSLDHALSATELNWVIPCSFATSNVEESTGKLLQRVVQIGRSEDDEVSGVKGASATQKATAYPIYIGGKLIRLIDTPGIGDTRGIEQDKENMVHTLSVLKNYETLHGILILLKPNNARISVMFKFCINELLTHLHRDAASNVVFGFTNTRGAMYTPGDAVGPLEAQLENYKGLLPGLFRNTVYCFDSESFRYLAARKQALDLGNLDDYRRSWDHSASESQRLMAYFEKRNPHLVKSTLGLNETRDLISRLVHPMAEVIKVVSVTIENSKKAMGDLSITQKSGEELKPFLNLTKTNLVTQELKNPYTVCDHSSCVSRVTGPNGTGSVVLRKSLCHDPCSLKEIQRNVAGAKGITGCAAFTGGSGKCNKCSHTPADHMHVMVLYNQKTESSIDPIVQAKLNANASELQIKQAQLDALSKQIAEYQAEKDLLEDAQAKFSWYLEKNSITVHNDVTIEYLDHLIKDEKTKMGPEMRPDELSRANLLIDALERSKTKHKEFVAAMRKGKQSLAGSSPQTLDEQGVLRLITSLCAMQHYGAQLKQAANAVQGAYAKQFRERPFRVRRPETFMSGAPASSWKRTMSKLQPGKSSGSEVGGISRKPVQSMLIDFEDEPTRKSEVLTAWPPQDDPSSNSLPSSSSTLFVADNGREEPPAPPPYTYISYRDDSNRIGPTYTASNASRSRRHTSLGERAPVSSPRQGLRRWVKTKIMELKS